MQEVVKHQLPVPDASSRAPPLRPSSTRTVLGDVSTAAGLKALNDFLAERSYVEGFTPSQADAEVFDSLPSAPPPALCHLQRWYKHIQSFQAQRGQLPSAQTQFVLPQASDEDEDMDLFGSEDEEQEEGAARLKEQRLAEYTARKSKKPPLVAKSSILLDVKPWDDETDMEELEEHVRSVRLDGLLWGASKLVPVGYGIRKLQISCVVEDEKVGTDVLEEAITAFQEHVQSVDVAAFNKI